MDSEARWRHKTITTTAAQRHSTWHGTSAQRASTSTPGQAQGKKIVVASKLPNLRILHDVLIFVLELSGTDYCTFNWMMFFCFSALLVRLFLFVLSSLLHIGLRWLAGFTCATHQHHHHPTAISVCIIIEFVPPATQSSLGTVLDSLGPQKDFWWVVWGLVICGKPTQCIQPHSKWSFGDLYSVPQLVWICRKTKCSDTCTSPAVRALEFPTSYLTPRHSWHRKLMKVGFAFKMSKAQKAPRSWSWGNGFSRTLSAAKAVPLPCCLASKARPLHNSKMYIVQLCTCTCRSYRFSWYCNSESSISTTSFSFTILSQSSQKASL